MNEKRIYGNFKLGILGGGQLGRMLIQEAVNYNVHVCVLDGDPNAPCLHIANEFTVGNLMDYDAVYNFGKKADVLTIEIEHVNIDALEQLAKEGITVYPQPKVLRIIKDKGLQKQFYKEHQIPTAPFHLISSKNEILQYRDKFPLIQKTRTEGYDGKGVTRLDDPDNLTTAFEGNTLLEEMIDFKKEIAVLVARNKKGECKAFPVVDMEFNPEANLVEFLYSPSSFDEDLEQKAQNLAIEVAKAYGITGLLAVEMFVTQDDQLLVNEVAPRPHNSGHHTIESNYTSQFEQHLRAILDLPLGSTDIVIPSVMINLLGEKGYQGEVLIEGLEEAINIPGVYFHLYGKKKTKPFRKMGHITVCDENIEIAKQKARKLMNLVKIKSVNSGQSQ